MAVDVGICHRCGSKKDSYSPEGWCGPCILQNALTEKEAIPEPLPFKTQSFGNYELLEEIARGGMGIVYRARQLQLNRIVALKVILSGPFASRAEIVRFRSEAESAANLRHPNIVAIHETGEHGGQHFFSMDYVPGRNLAELTRGGPLPSLRAAKYAYEIALAIQYAHEQHLLHRDLKPSNVLIDADDKVRITDFGVAKRLRGDFGITVTGQLVGSPNYMPPEQAVGKSSVVGPPADVYGIGAILYHLLTGRAPFQASAVPELLRQVCEKDPLAPALLVPGVPLDLQTVCLKCLEKEPSRRYPSAEALAQDLDRFLRGRPVLARPISRLQQVVRWCQRERSMSAALGLITFLLLIVVIGSPIALYQVNSSRQATEFERQRAERSLYTANVHLANEAVQIGDLVRAREILQRITLSPDQDALRGWEWRRVAGLCLSDELRTLGHHESWVSAVAASGDGQQIASIDESGIAKLWDSLGAVIWSWDAHPLGNRELSDVIRLHAIAFTPDGRNLITTGRDAAVRLWDSSNQILVGEIEDLPTPVVRLAVSPDGKMLTTCSGAGQIQIRSLEFPSPKLLATFDSGIKFLLAAIEFSLDGTNLFVGGAEQPVRVFDISDLGNPRTRMILEDSSPPLAFSARGQLLATVARDRHWVQLWSYPELKLVWSKRTQGGGVRSLGISDDAKQIACGLLDGQIIVLPISGDSTPVQLAGHGDMVSGLNFLGTSHHLVSGSYDKSVRVWDGHASTRQPVVIRHGHRVRAVAFSPDSKLLASIAADRSLDPALVSKRVHTTKLFSLPDFEEQRAVTNVAAGLLCNLSFSPTGRELAVDDFSSLRFLEVDQLGEVAPTGMRDAIFLPNSSGRYYISEKGICFRIARTGIESLAMPGNVSAIALSPTAQVIASADATRKGSIDFWEIGTHRLLRTFGPIPADISALTFSPDGKTLLSTYSDSSVGLWDMAAETVRGTIRSHSGELNRAAFSPDGRTLATCGGDDLIRLWNVEQVEEVAVLAGHSASVNGLAFSPDGTWLASASDDGTIRLWRAASMVELSQAAARARK